VAQALGRPLVFHQALLDQVAARFDAMQRPMSASNRVQAYIPQGARPLENRYGTAPVFLVEDDRGTVIVLPGVPMEMRALFEEYVIPYLREERHVRGTTLVHTCHVAGLGESSIGERIADLMRSDNPTVGTSAKQGRCELRIVVKAGNQEEAESLLAPVVEGLAKRLGNHLVGSETPVEQIARLLQAQQQTLALYENMWQAPCYRLLATDKAALAQVQGVAIDPLLLLVSPVAGEVHPTDREAVARAGALLVQDRWQTSLGLGLAVTPTLDETGYAEVVAVLVGVAIAQPIVVRRRYDLRQPEAWDYAGHLALEVVRTYLLQSQPATG
jgi:molybdopterin-biosynthesis enzyme MoeA-like protein